MATALDLLMSAKEDVNLLSEESDICTIDAKTRIIFVPSTIVVGGVQSDKNAERIKFSCPKIVGDNLDLSKFSVRINFENVSSVDFNVSIKDQYICDDVAVDGENVTFSWLIGRNAARYMGTVRFIVCAVKIDSDSNISVEWNTAIAEVPVLEGIEIDQPQIGQEEKDVINQLLELTKNTSAEAVQNVNSAKEQAIKDIQSVSQPDTTLTIEGGLAEAKATGEAIGSLKEDIGNLTSWDLKGDIAHGKLPKELVSTSKTTLTTIKSIKATNGVATFKDDNVTFKNDTGKQGTYDIMFGEPFEIKESDYAYLIFNDLEAYGSASTIALLDSKGNTISSTVQYIPATATFWKLNNSNNIEIYGISIDIPVPSYNKTVKFFIGLGTETVIPTYEPRYSSKIVTYDNLWDGKTVVAYGDSQTAQNKWQPYVKEVMNNEFVVDGHGGYPVALAVKNQVGFCLSSDFLLNSLLEKIDNASAITIMGGTNDFNYDTDTDTENNIKIGENTDTENNTFKGALNKIITTILTHKSDIVVILMSPIGGLTKKANENLSTPLKNGNGYTIYDYAKATKDIAEYHGLPFIDVYNCGITIYNSKNYIEDGVHMNSEKGAKLVADKVIDCMKRYSNLLKIN